MTGKFCLLDLAQLMHPYTIKIRVLKAILVHFNICFNRVVFFYFFRTIKVEVYDWDRDGR